MPSFKVGARGEGAVSSVLDLVQSRQRRAVEEQDERRKFDQRLKELVLQREDVTPEYVSALVSGQSTHGINPITPGGALSDIYAVNATTKTLDKVGSVPKSAKVYAAGSAGTTPQDDIEAIADDIMQGVLSPILSESSSFRDRSRVAAALSRRGIDSMKLQNDWRAIQTATKNANSTQQLRMRQALSSVQGGVETLRTLNDEFSRTGWTPANWLELKAALSGTDPTKRDAATRFVTQINAMTDELAQGFQGGGVPTESAFKLARDILNPVYGNRQLSAALDQLETNINIRLNAIESVQALVPGGEVTQTYERFNRPPPAHLPATQRPAAYQEGQTAINRATGQRLIFKGGRWQPM